MLFNGRKQKRKLARSAFETEINDDTYTAEKGSKSNNKYKKKITHTTIFVTLLRHIGKKLQKIVPCVSTAPLGSKNPPLAQKQFVAAEQYPPTFKHNPSLSVVFPLARRFFKI